MLLLPISAGAAAAACSRLACARLDDIAVVDGTGSDESRIELVLANEQAQAIAKNEG